MNIVDAAYHLVHNYPGGSDALAQRMRDGDKKMSPAVLRSKVNPNVESHHLTLEESVRLQELTGRNDILVAMADELGMVVIARPHISDADLSSTLRHLCAEFGRYMDVIDQSLVDERVTPNERKKMEAQLIRLITRATILQSMLSSQTAGKP